MLPAIATQTVERLRGVPTDNGYGDTAIDWTSPDIVSVPGCSVQPVAGEEILLNRDAVVSRWKLFAPLSADITSLDRIRHNGMDYDIDGSVQDWPDVSGLGYKSCLLRKAVG